MTGGNRIPTRGFYFDLYRPWNGEKAGCAFFDQSNALRFVTELDDNNELTIVIVKDFCDLRSQNGHLWLLMSDLENANIEKI